MNTQCCGIEAPEREHNHCVTASDSGVVKLCDIRDKAGFIFRFPGNTELWMVTDEATRVDLQDGTEYKIGDDETDQVELLPPGTAVTIMVHGKK